MTDPVADSLLEHRKHFPALEECVHLISHSLGCVPAQAKEAYAFALLGWLSWHGLPGALPSVTGAARAAVLGSWTPSGPAYRGTPAVPAPRRLRIAA